VGPAKEHDMHIPPFSIQTAAVVTPLALQVIIELAAYGAFALAMGSEIAGMASGKVLPDKLGKQVGLLGVWLLLYTLLTAGAVTLFLFYRHPDLMQPWIQNPTLGAPLAGLLVWTSGFCLAYRWTWSSLGKARGPHLALGALGVLGALATLGFSLGGKMMAMQLPHGHLGPITLADILASAARPGYWAMLAHYALLAPACAGALALPWLVLRRNRDDWGRDYYAYATRACSRWAAWCILGSVAGFGALVWLTWPVMSQSPYSQPFLLLAGAGAVLALLACLCWMLIARSAAPMRHKPAMFLALLLLWLGVAGMVCAQYHVLILG